MRSVLDSIVTEKILHLMNDSIGVDIPDAFSEAAGLKNVCAKVSSQISDEIDSICGLLGISKRLFIESALIEAIDKSNEIIELEGFFESRNQSVQASNECPEK